MTSWEDLPPAHRELVIDKLRDLAIQARNYDPDGFGLPESEVDDDGGPLFETNTHQVVHFSAYEAAIEKLEGTP